MLYHLKVGGECRIDSCMNASGHTYECVSELLNLCIKKSPLSHPKNNLVSLPPTTKKRLMGMCMNKSVSFGSDASRNCHDPTQWFHQSLLPTKKTNGIWAHIVSEIPG